MNIPKILVYSRVAIGCIILAMLFAPVRNSSQIVFYLIIIGFASDFFDGYIARLQGISTTSLRRLDTIVDRFFWISILIYLWVSNPVFFQQKKVEILVVLALEVINYAISFLRFKRGISTHAILSKLWAVSLLIAFCELAIRGGAAHMFDMAIWFGVISRLDTGLIMLILPEWNHDIPTFYHAIMIRKGKEIKRHKLFNG